MIPEMTEEQRIWEQSDIDPWLCRYERGLGHAPDGSFIMRVYLDDSGAIPFGHVRNVGCQIIYEPNFLHSVYKQEPIYDTSTLACEQRGLKER